MAAAILVIRRVPTHTDETPRPAVLKPSTASVQTPAATQPQSQPPLAALSSYPDDATAFAALAEYEVAQVRDNFSLDRWRALPEAEEGWAETPKKELQPTDWPRKECTSYVKKDALPSGAQVVSALYFYPPAAPTPAVFPSMQGQELIGTCVLAVVRIKAAPSLSDFDATMVREAQGAKFSQQITPVLEKKLSGKYGENVGTKYDPFWGTGRARVTDAARWIQNAEIISGYDTKGLTMPNEDELMPAPYVFVQARLPLVELADGTGRAQDEPSKEAEQFRHAVSLAGVEAALSQRMQSLYDLDVQTANGLQNRLAKMCEVRCPETQTRLPQPSGDDWRKPLVPVLQDWFAALKNADSAHRAAGLVAADFLLKAFGSVGPFGHLGGIKQSKPADDRLRADLEQVGATFDRAFGDGSYYYKGNWVDEARQLAQDTEAGRLALLIWMSRGDGCNAGGTEFFRTVISQGDALLQKKVDPATAAQVHFMMGDAYADMVFLAEGPDPNGDYASVKIDEPAVSRTKALEHYRAGMEIDGTSTDAKDAWRQAWKLSAGLLPNARYVCFGD